MACASTSRVALARRVRPSPSPSRARAARAAPRCAGAGGEDEPDDFEARLAAISAKTGKKRDLREARKAAKAEAAAASKAGPKARGLTELPEDDLEGEVEYLAFRPSVGDLAANVVLGATILWLPLSFAAIGRFTFVKYRLTDRRLTVRSEPPVGEQERTDVAFEDVEEVLTVGNLLWGDLLVKLKNGDKVELRSIDNFFEIKEYIMKKAEECRKDQVDKLSGSGSSSAAAKEPAKAKVKTSAPSRAKGQGF